MKAKFHFNPDKIAKVTRARFGVLRIWSSVCLVLQILFLQLPASIMAQHRESAVLTGVVGATETHEVLPGATIRVMGTTLGTTTNSDGRFRILLSPGRHRLIFSFIGFRPDTADIVLEPTGSSIGISLRTSDVSLPEVTVYPASSNPADGIIRRASYAKVKWESRLRSYEFDAYTKTVMRVEEGGEKADTIIGGIMETQTKGYWKAPDLYREVISAKRQTANFTSDQNVFTVGRVLNFNDDIVHIDRYAIPGPTSPDALEHYDFNIKDTLYLGSSRVFRISVEPKDEASPLFKGWVDIEEGSFAMIHAHLGLSDPTALEPMENPVSDEEFTRYGDEYWLPIELKTNFSVKFVVPPMPRIFFAVTSVLYDYRINPDFPQRLFDDRTFPRPALIKDPAVWQSQQVLPLTGEEVEAYARLDSLTANLPVILKSILFLTQLPDRIGELPITSFSDLYHFNRVEGSYLGIGLKSSSLIDRTDLTLAAGYGFADKTWKYDLGVGYRLPFAGGVSVGGSVFRRLANREEEEIFSRVDVTLGALLYRDDYRDYFLSSGWRGSVGWKISPSLGTQLEFDDERQSSVRKNTDYSFFDEDYLYRDNPPIDDGKMRSVKVSLEFDSRTSFESGRSTQWDEGSSYIRFSGSVEMSSPRFMNSDFSFLRYRLNAMRHQMTFASAFVNLWANGGTSQETLPSQRMFEIQTAYGGYSAEHVLSTLGTLRLLSRSAVVGGAEYDIPGSFFKWTNVPVVRDAWFDLVLFVHGAAAEGFKPMAEAGFGFVNIIPLIRTDFTWGAAGLCRGFAWTVRTTLGI